MVVVSLEPSSASLVPRVGMGFSVVLWLSFLFVRMSSTRAAISFSGEDPKQRRRLIVVRGFKWIGHLSAMVSPCQFMYCLTEGRFVL